MAKGRRGKLPRSEEGIGGLDVIEDELRRASVILDCLRYTLAYRHEALDSELDLQWSDAALVIEMARDFVMNAHTTTLEAMNPQPAPSLSSTGDAPC